MVTVAGPLMERDTAQVAKPPEKKEPGRKFRLYQWSLRTMMLGIAIIAVALGAGSYFYRYYLDYYQDEFRIECDVPGTVVYLNGRELGTAPVRIFSHDYMLRHEQSFGKVVPYYSLRDYRYGRGIELRTAKFGDLLLEFAVPAARNNAVKRYATQQGERVFMHSSSWSQGEHKCIAQFNLLPSSPELWVECDEPEAIIFVNGKQAGQSPILLAKMHVTNTQLVLDANGEGVIWKRDGQQPLKLECASTNTSLANDECYERDGKTWLRIQDTEMKSEVSGHEILRLLTKTE